ncbi:MAG: hypothetical protein IPH31_14420 [Lewinellaceae bacterium]|nr:hypothetical protein [Lewinellaceae bacterium]
MLIKRDSSFRVLQNSLFLPERGELVCGVEMDSLKFFAENQTLREDKNWRLESRDNLSYQLYDTRSGQLIATLLSAEVWPEFADTGYKDAVNRIWAVTTPFRLLSMPRRR